MLPPLTFVIDGLVHRQDISYQRQEAPPLHYDLDNVAAEVNKHEGTLAICF